MAQKHKLTSNQSQKPTGSHRLGTGQNFRTYRGKHINSPILTANNSPVSPECGEMQMEISFSTFIGPLYSDLGTINLLHSAHPRKKFETSSTASVFVHTPASCPWRFGIKHHENTWLGTSAWYKSSHVIYCYCNTVGVLIKILLPSRFMLKSLLRDGPHHYHPRYQRRISCLKNTVTERELTRT